MDNRLPSTNSSDPAEALKSILSSGTAVVKDQDKIVITGQKLSNDYLKWFTDGLKEKGVSDNEILKMVLSFDKGVEDGKIKQETFEKLMNDEAYAKKIMDAVESRK